MAEIIESLPWWQEAQKEAGDICHDCALDTVADMLVFAAHSALRDEGQAADRQHISEALLRAALQANWTTAEEITDLDDSYAKFRAEHGAP